MERPEWFRTGFVALAVVGIVGVVVSDAIGLRIELTAFCGVVGLGVVVVVTQGESFVAPVTFSVGMLSAYLAVVYGARYDLLLGLLFAVLSALAIGRGSEYHRAYST